MYSLIIGFYVKVLYFLIIWLKNKKAVKSSED